MIKNKRKIFNDPVLGFIKITDDLIFDLIEHSYFQRLRRISQTGLSSYVYPGANHTRFLHALGCMHLMQLSLKVLKEKGITISQDEERAAQIAILLHDIGHGPFSHALEATLMEKVYHEKISINIMKILNKEFKGELSLAIEIFLNKYPRPFFYQLISSQIDLDRLDYLKRDSFFTGVSEGNINSERIITMMNVIDDNLVIDEKGIYSLEKYLTSRTFMYWQVYFHKTAVSAEYYLIGALKRAKELTHKGIEVIAPNTLKYFLNKREYNELTPKDIEMFSVLDDSDIISALKIWQHHEDTTLQKLSSFIMKRQLPFSRINSQKIPDLKIENLIKETEKLYNIDNGTYFVHQNKLSFLPYRRDRDSIILVQKNNKTIELENIGNQIFMKSLNKEVVKYHLCIPTDINTFL